MCKTQQFSKKNHFSNKDFQLKKWFNSKLHIKKLQKLKKGKIEKEKNNTSCFFCLKAYVKNKIFERKTILEKNSFQKNN